MLRSMMDGSLGFQNRVENELHSLMEAFKESYDRKIHRFILKTYHGDSYWLWRNSLEHGVPSQFEEIVRQHNSRKRDPNFKNEVHLCDPEDNQLATYLAKQGAARWNQMVIVRRFLGDF